MTLATVDIVLSSITPGVRVRLPATANPLIAGKLATVSHQLTVSKRWRVTLDEADARGRHIVAVFREDELEVIEDADEYG